MTSDTSTEPDAAATDDVTDDQQDTTDWKTEARKWEQRAKDNQKTAKDLEKQARAAMTDAERALSEAEAKGRTAARSEFGSRLVRTEFDAAAGRRNPDFDIKATLDDLNLDKFVTEDGEPDLKAIKAAVERLVPAPAGGTPSYDGGTRSTSKGPTDMNQVIRKAAGRA